MLGFLVGFGFQMNSVIAGTLTPENIDAATPDKQLVNRTPLID